MSEINKIPPAVAKILKASLSRIRRILLFRGICATLAVFVASVLAIMAIDAMVTIYAGWVRWLLWCGVVSATGSVAWFALIKPLRRRISLSDVALLIERNHPELEERLSTVVELAAEGREGEVWSKELVNEITKSAISDAGKVSPKKEFTARTIKPRFIAAAAAVFILLGLFAAFPTATARLVARALLPSAEVDNIYASSLKVAPGDQVLLAGSPFKVSLAVDGGFPSKAFVRTSVNGRSEAVERMVRMTEEEAKGPVFYEFDYPSVSESFTYRVNCGSALTKAYNVKVVPTPTFEDRKIRIEHPAYTGRAPSEYTNSAQVVAVPGSRVVISFRKPREDITGYIKIPGDRTIEADPFGDDELTFSFDVDKDTDGVWSAMAQDSNGFSNQVVSSAVTVVKDTPPTVDLTVPDMSEIKLPRSGVLPVEFKAKDDFKVAKAVLEIAVGTADYQDLRDIELTQGQDGFVVGSDMVSILALGSRLGKSAAFQIRVRVEDNLPEEFGGPGIARSSSVLVELQTKGQNGGKSLGQQELSKQIEETKKEAEDIRKTLETAMRHMEGARQSYQRCQNAWAMADAKKNHDLCKTHITNAEGLFADFIQNLLDTRLSTGAAILRPVMDKHIVPVRQEVEDMYLVDPSSRYEPAKKCYEHFKDLMKAYDEALKKYQILTKTAEDMQKLEDLKEQQEALAEAAEKGEMSPQELGDAEKQLMDEMQQQLQDDMQRSLDAEMKKADELAKKIDELAQKQKDIKEKMSGDEQKRAEDQLANDLGKLAKDTDQLMQDVEKQTGTPEMDESKTAEPLESAKWSQEDAQDSAKEAAKNLGEQKNEDAKANMDDVSEALKQAKEQMAEAQNRMKQANERFSQEAKEMQELMDKINEAMQAAMEAAKAELGQQMSPEELQQMAQQAAEQMAGQEKMTPEQMKAMLEAMKEQMQNMTPEQAKAMAEAMKEAMKQAMEQMKQEFGNLSPEELKAKLGELAKQAAQEMQNQQPQMQQPQSPEMQRMQQKFESVADMMKQQMQQMMQQQNMPQEQFQQQMQQPQSPMQQQMQQTQQQQQQQQQSQSQQESKQHQESQSPTSNVREALGEDEGVDWFRMKSSSSSGAEADPMDDVPSEYRGLVRDYFKALNEGGK